MIELKQHRAIFVSVPKCGTNTLYAILKQHFHGVKIGRGFHPTHVPCDRIDWLCFTCVRNPYDRAVSFWWSTCMRRGDRYGFKQAVDDPTDFTSFMHHLIHARPCVSDLGPSMSHHLRGVRVDRVLRLECLRQDMLDRLPFVKSLPTLPQLNPTQDDRGRWQDYVTPVAAHYVREWAHEDFERFGYPLDEEAYR